MTELLLNMGTKSKSDSNYFLQEYKQLLVANIEAQNKITRAFEESLKNLETERKIHEDFNKSSWANKHKALLLILAPIVTIIVIFAGAYAFVSTGHSIVLKAGDYQVEAK